jgi:hypothetical protein
VPGTAALNSGGDAAIASVSCASAGNCGAGGGYADGSRNIQAYVVSEINGTWQNAEEVPGTAALNQGGAAHVQSVSCASAGNCGAGGYYRNGGTQAFVVNETNGTWQNAGKVPGTGTLNKGRSAIAYSVSCASVGNCSAGGYYKDGSGHKQAFVVSETKGTWRNAQEVPGTAALNTGGSAVIRSVSCASAASCSAGGYYTDGSRRIQAFVVNKT